MLQAPGIRDANPAMPSPLATTLRRATPADAPALVDLVNSAYAIESSFVDGDRTNEREIVELVDRFVVLDRADGLAAAVHVDVRADGAGYFRMLSVSPELQGMGLGTRLVHVAEALCAAMGCAEVRL